MQVQYRNSNIELLRIFSMLIIVLYHCVLYCYGGGAGFFLVAPNNILNNVWGRLLSMFGALGVNIFVLISGYCLMKNDTNKVSLTKLMKFYGQLLFYSVGITVPYLVATQHSISLSEIVSICFPISNETWWFASSYFVLLIIHPFINKFLLSINQKEYQYYLLVIFTLASLLPFYSYFADVLTWFVCLYSLSAYVKLYGANHKCIQSRHYLLVAIVSLVFILVSSYIIDRIPAISSKNSYFYGKRQIPMLVLSFSLFMSFLTMRQFHSRWINIIGLSTFGVYLISDHAIIRDFLWKNLLSSITSLSSPMFILYSLLFVVSVFICCSLIDILRHYTFERCYMKLIYALSKNTQTIRAKIYCSIRRLFF